VISDLDIWRSAAVIVIVIVANLSACDPIGNGDLASMPTDRLCQYYQSERAALRGRSAEVRAELERRSAVDPKHWAAIDAGDIQYGMNKCEIEAMGGPPIADSHAHSAAGEIEVLAYPLANATLINGRVTAYTKASLP
jgi:hypothetical protein